MALPKSDLISLEDMQNLYFSLSKSKCFFDKKVHRADYIDKQLQTALIKRHLESKQCVLARLKAIKEQEEALPTIRSATELIKNADLQQIFVQQFQKPTVDKLYKELELAEENRKKRKEVVWMELTFLKENAKLITSGNIWCLHFRIMSLIRQLQNPSGENSPQGETNLQLREMEVLTPWDNISKSHQQICRPIGDFEPNLKCVNAFLNQVQKFKVKEQVRRKNAIILRDKLNQQKNTFRDIQKETAALEDKIILELQKLEKEVELNRRPRSLSTNTIPKPQLKVNKLESLAAVDFLVESVMKHQSMQPSAMAKILEKRTQTLINEVANLRKNITTEPQITLEKKYIAMERRKLKQEAGNKEFQKRAEKLVRKFQIALMPPSSRVFRPMEKFKRKEQPKKLTAPEQVDQKELEELICFDSEVSKSWMVQNYKPTALVDESEAGEDALLLKWVAGKRQSSIK